MKKIITILLLCLTLTLTSCGDSKNNEFNLINDGKLYVATCSDYAPFEFIDLTKSGQDKYVGADMELARYIASELKLELVINAMDFDVTLTALSTKKADLAISGFTYKEDRALNYLFSDNYSDGEGLPTFFIKASDVDKYKTVADFDKSNVKIAVQSGSTQADAVDAQLKNATIVKIGNITEALSLLNNGTYDAVVIASIPGNSNIANMENVISSDISLEDSESTFYVLANKENQALIDQVNKIIVKVKNEKLYEKWVNDAYALIDKLGENVGELIPEEE